MVSTYKARFVVRDDKQRPWIDYKFTFAIVICLENFWAIVALMAIDNLEAFLYDVVISFMNVVIDAPFPIYVAPPKDYEQHNNHG